jgi:ketosteroid isomerase-like protein
MALNATASTQKAGGVHMKIADAAELHTTWASRFNAKDLDGMVALAETDSVFVPQPGVVVAGEAAVRNAEQQFLNIGYRSR